MQSKNYIILILYDKFQAEIRKYDNSKKKYGKIYNKMIILQNANSLGHDIVLFRRSNFTRTTIPLALYTVATGGWGITKNDFSLFYDCVTIIYSTHKF